MAALPDSSVTKIEPQKRHPGRYSIFIDGEFALGVDESVVAKFNLRPGIELDAAELEQLVLEQEVAGALKKAFGSLQRRSRSKADLERRLKDKGYSENVIQEALNRLSQLGLVDDTKHAQALTESLLRKNLGPSVLLHKLRADGISRELAEQTVAEQNERVPEAERAIQLVEKLRPRLANLPVTQRRRKMYEHLHRRGFSGNVIAGIIDTESDD